MGGTFRRIAYALTANEEPASGSAYSDNYTSSVTTTILPRWRQLEFPTDDNYKSPLFWGLTESLAGQVDKPSGRLWGHDYTAATGSAHHRV